jgi:regulator of protease activity HflC (stomatin/prohibitin superfamily)
MNTNKVTASQERVVRVQNGWVMLILLFAAWFGDIGLFIFAIADGIQTTGQPHGWLVGLAVFLFPIIIILMTGLFSLQPNQARVLVLFGAYKGTIRTPGFYWGNPFYSNGPQATAGVQAQTQSKNAPGGTATTQKTLGRNKISLRARTLNGNELKVNDKRGNPIEIAAVVVWRVEETAQAMFDVDSYRDYVTIQSESALRHLASLYAYDHSEDETEITLRSNMDEVSKALRDELQERFAKAGVVVDEARLSHLAYAPEIAQAMLRRQQAEAVIAARTKIVQGAVSMVDMALKELAEKHVVALDDERRAAMVSNLMVVLCAESEVHPVVNTGTLYT